ncbi:MAG: GAF domain-containing protein [Chloroflexi bacterium]|nr:GAF domain-containing protein [Chloroflexota bacterium]
MNTVWLYALILTLALATTSAIIWRRLRSRRALEARLSELSVLADVGRAILGSQLDLTRLAELVCQQAGQIVDTSIFQLGLFEGDRYRLLIWVMDGQRRPPLEFRLTSDSPGIVGWIRESKQHLLVQDFEKQTDSLPARPRYISSDPPRSAAFVPLIVGETVLGVMAIQSRQPGAFSERDLRLLSIIANHAAAALENGRLLEQAQRRAAHLELLSEVSQQINAIQPLPALYRQVVDLIADKFNGYEVSFFEKNADRLILLATTSAASQGEPPTWKMGDGPVGQAAVLHAPVVIQNLPEYPRDMMDDSTAGAGAEIALPIEIDGRVLGVLDVQSQGGAAFDEARVSVFKSLAEQLAFAILEAQVYAAERRRSEQLSAIAQVSRTVTSTLELDDLLDEVLDLISEREYFGYKRAHVFLAHDGRLVFRAGLGKGAARWSVEGLAHALDGPGIIAEVGRTGRAALVADTALHPEFTPGPGLEDTRSEMAAPMMMAGRLLGVFDVQSEQVGAFSQDELQTLQTLSDTLAVAVRNARLFEAERRRRRLAEILREVSVALTATLRLDSVFDLILNGLARVLSYDVASVLLVNEVDEVVLRASRGSLHMIRALGATLAVKLFPGGEPFPTTVDFSQVDDQNDYHRLLSLPEPHVCLGAVLALRGEHLGYLVVDRTGASQFLAEEVELIAAFASQAAVAIENARLYNAQLEQAWVSTTLLQVAEATARAPELAEVLDTVAQLTPKLVGVEQCAVLLAEGEEFVLASYHSSEPKLAEAEEDMYRRFTLEEWPQFADMIGSGEPAVIVPEDVDNPMPESLRDLFEGVTILLPMLAKGRVLGALVVGQTPGEVLFTPQRIRLIGGIANQAALAIETAALHQSQQEEGWVSTALLQVAEAVVQQPTLEEGLETVARLIPMLVGVEKVAIFRRNEETGVFYASQVMGLSRSAASQFTGQKVTPGDLGIDITRESATPVFELTLPAPLSKLFGAETCMAWPLWARGDLLGALVVERVTVLGRRLSILNGIAQQLTMAMENARLAREVALQQRTERELEVARDIQSSFLPEASPKPPGWEVCALWQAARQVGGDFYDFIPLPPDDGQERWGIAIADVADKGVPAALYMAVSRTLLRSVAINRVSPAATLARLNQLIMSDARSDQFVTVFYGVWEPATGRFTYANGGHNPPIWADGGPSATPLTGRGAAVGVFPDIQYQEHEVRLQRGDTLFLYTDGLPDAINAAQEEFGLSRVIDVVNQTCHESAQTMLQVMDLTVQAHVGAMEAFDDLTMVVIRRAE